MYKCFKRYIPLEVEPQHDFEEGMIGEHSDEEEDETFAVKVARSSSQAILDATELEYNIIKELDHPNVIKGFAMFKDEEKEEVSIVLNLIKGGDLLD